ncbi:O-antigen ligase family protein [Thermus caldilimi]|uniref:O-antigen ligase family protein n=1 Tax=Thermus caldilimi TaxID=2483360 RepID=UPI001F0E5241|nr:O-antigen ligase family protein [Thermus caldilimi]
MRWLLWALALAPLFPPLALLAPLCVGYLRRLPPWALGLLAVYALSLLLPAVFAPEPLAFPLALGRVLYVLGLVGAGVALFRQLREPSRALLPLGYGLFLLYGSAFLASYLAFGDQAVGQRLMHPFHNPVGLGFLGALGVLLAVYVRYPWPFRLLLSLLGGAVLLLSGSRGGMLALLLGSAGGLLFRGRGLWALGLAGFLLFAALSLDTPISERFFQAHLSGREGLWLRAYEVFQAHPWTGVGPYVLGDYLKGTLFGDCFLFPLIEAKGLACPDWLRPLGGLWTFAHNHLLQALGESGVLGAVGLLLLVGGFWRGPGGRGSSSPSSWPLPPWG